MEVIEGDVYIDKIDDFKEAGACGTAAVIQFGDVEAPKGWIYKIK